MIGSIDILASSTMEAVTSRAGSAKRCALRAAPSAGTGCPADLGGRVKSSRTPKIVSSAATPIMAPPAKNVPRMPIRFGSRPPTSGPIRLPVSAPVDRTPSAHPARSGGACVPIITVAADA
ncbi:hypothetical protein D3C87_1586310 [compost metagenome]